MIEAGKIKEERIKEGKEGRLCHKGRLYRKSVSLGQDKKIRMGASN